MGETELPSVTCDLEALLEGIEDDPHRKEPSPSSAPSSPNSSLNLSPSPQLTRLNPLAKPFEPTRRFNEPEPAVTEPSETLTELVEFDFEREVERASFRSNYANSLCILQGIRRRFHVI